MIQGEMGFREQKSQRQREDTSSTEMVMCREADKMAEKLKDFLPPGLCFPRKGDSEASCWEDVGRGLLGIFKEKGNVRHSQFLDTQKDCQTVGAPGWHSR